MAEITAQEMNELQMQSRLAILAKWSYADMRSALAYLSGWSPEVFDNVARLVEENR